MRTNITHVRTRFGDIAFTGQGEGPPALFVHCVFPNGFLWRAITERLSARHRGIAIDLLAHCLHATLPGAQPPVILEGAQPSFPEERPAALAHALSRFWACSAPAAQPRTEGAIA